MARKPHALVELSGPLFDDGMPDNVQDAIAEQVEELGDEGAGVLMGFISAAGFVRSGGFLHSVTSEFHRSRGIGYAKIYPTESWGGEITVGHSGAKTKSGKKRMTVQSVKTTAGGPTRTWFETGVRGGRRPAKRKGIYGFRKTTQRMDAMNPQQRVADAVMAVIS